MGKLSRITTSVIGNVACSLRSPMDYKWLNKLLNGGLFGDVQSTQKFGGLECFNRTV